MSNLISIYDNETGVNIVREMTPEEIAERENEIVIFMANKKAREQEQAEKEAAKADLLNRLGITAEEAKLLLS